ncbi:MAG: polysaccharide deacetylase family protein [Pseudomonadota bacterium]
MIIQAGLFFLILFTALPLPAAVVLEYHHISDKTPKSTSISPAKFNAQMDYLANNHFNIVSVVALAEKLRKGETLPDKTVAISFDDSYATVYHAAYPLLKKRGWPFTFFVNTAAVSTSSLFVTWDQLREMSRNGATIANHTLYHNHLPRLKANETLSQWRNRTKAEIEQAQKNIEKEIGSAPKIFAYPFGEYDIEVQKILKELDFVAFGQQSGPLVSTKETQKDLQAVPRFAFGGSFTELDDFIMKVNTLPMPINHIQFFSDKRHEINNIIVRQGDKPYLVLSINDKNLLNKIRCFATGQGPAVSEIIDGKLWVQAKQPLPQGRTRYNCTAASSEKGRFYWYTQQWLATDKNGTWNYSD